MVLGDGQWGKQACRLETWHLEGAGCAGSGAGGADSPQIPSLPLGGKCSSTCSIAPPVVCDFCRGMFSCICVEFDQKIKVRGGEDLIFVDGPDLPPPAGDRLP